VVVLLGPPPHLPSQTERREVLEEDDILGWRLGGKRDLTATQGDKWLESEELSRDKIIKELIIERLSSIDYLGGYRSKGFGEVAININPTA